MYIREERDCIKQQIATLLPILIIKGKTITAHRIQNYSRKLVVVFKVVTFSKSNLT